MPPETSESLRGNIDIKAYLNSEHMLCKIGDENGKTANNRNIWY